jgi:hypothetical protein
VDEIRKRQIPQALRHFSGKLLESNEQNQIAPKPSWTISKNRPNIQNYPLFTNFYIWPGRLCLGCARKRQEKSYAAKRGIISVLFGFVKKNFSNLNNQAA